jgi:hypothetical protein
VEAPLLGLLGVAIVALIVGRRRSRRRTGDISTLQAIATGATLAVVTALWLSMVMSAVIGR